MLDELVRFGVGQQPVQCLKSKVGRYLPFWIHSECGSKSKNFLVWRNAFFLQQPAFERGQVFVRHRVERREDLSHVQTCSFQWTLTTFENKVTT